MKLFMTITLMTLLSAQTGNIESLTSGISGNQPLFNDLSKPAIPLEGEIDPNEYLLGPGDQLHIVVTSLENKLLPGQDFDLFIAETIEYYEFIGPAGETYYIGGGNEMQNIEITRLILDYLKKPESLIRFVEDRQGHDLRYVLNCEKLQQLGWEPKYEFSDVIRRTIDWYVENEAWWRKIKSGQYKEYYLQAYILSTI